MKTAIGVHETRYRIRLRPLLRIGCTSTLHFDPAQGHCSADYQTLRRILWWVRLVIVSAEQWSQAAFDDAVRRHHQRDASHDCENIEGSFGVPKLDIAKIEINTAQDRADRTAHKTL